MTPLSDIEKLEQAIADDAERCHAYFFHASEENKNAASAAREYRNDLLFRLAPSLIADWKQMRGEIERLTKELDEAYERVAHVCDISVEQITALDPSSPRINEAQAIAAVIRNLKAKEPKP